MKKLLPCILAVVLLFSGCGNTPAEPTPSPTPAETNPVVQHTGVELNGDVTRIELSDEGVTVDGQPAAEDKTAAVYTANDIIYYESGRDFTYGEGETADEHEKSEADRHTVVHITKPGIYSLSGKLSAGQIAVDLGEDAESDPAAVVTLVLSGVDITCTVAPAVIFYNVYECGDKDSPSMTVDTSAAGANVIVDDGCVNTVNGSYVARIYKPESVVLSADGKEVEDAKKLHKYDGAFYSKMSMNIYGGAAGDGVLNINADNEGLDSEMHLTINGGSINIISGNDGINTNEDGVSVTTVNGGELNIKVSGETGEGDGIDSNGWLVINGGRVTAAACAFSGDAGIDSDMGIYLNGGTVMAGGNMFDRVAGGSADYAVFSFAQRQTGGSVYTLKNADGSVAAEWTPENDFTYLVVSGDGVVPGTYTLWKGETQLAASAGGNGVGMGPGGAAPQLPGNIQRPEDGTEMTPPEGMEMPEGGGFPGGMMPPEGAERPGDMGMERPEGVPGDKPGMQRPDGATGNLPGKNSTEIVIVSGGNYFSIA